MELSKEIIQQAYLLLKSYTYHENLNLFLKNRVAAFECGDFDDRINALQQVLNSDDPFQHPSFKEWIEFINFRLLPKSIVRPEERRQNEYNKAESKNGFFLSNVSVSQKYESQKINYFIDAPVELHILDVLWCTVVGPALEEKLTQDCYGNRLHQTAKQFLQNIKGEQVNYGSGEIFKRYIDQYSAWRDQAINCATGLSEDGNDVALLSIDLKSYYYHIEVDFEEIQNCINDYFDDNDNLRLLGSALTKLLKSIFNAYKNIIYPSLLVSHPDCYNKSGLPIGFASSSILSNWYLSEFDNNISDLVRPAYYGRYVDDMLMVFKRPKIDSKTPIETFIDNYLAGQLHYSESEKVYEIDVGQNKLPIQPEKLILQFFDKHHSRAGLEVFKKEIEERSSAFKFLPSDDFDKELDQFAYDVLYDGSANKLRSIVGLAENETELARYLSSHITAHRLCKLNKRDIVLPQLKVFFRGVNALNFSRLWEKVYQYAVILNRPKFVVEFYASINAEISKIEFLEPSSTKIDQAITAKVHQDLELYNKLSLSICIGLLDITPFERITQKEYAELGITGLLDISMDRWPSVDGLEGLQLFSYHEDLNRFVRDFRHSNLIRHNLVAWPLANYTDYSGDLTDEVSFRSDESAELNENKIKLSPRFIHFDEWQVFSLNTELTKEKSLDEWQRSSIEYYKSLNYWDNFPVEYAESPVQNDTSITISTLTAGSKIKKSILRIALANLKVEEKDIEASLRKDTKPNVSLERQAHLYQVLNDAVREKSDLLVMPEVVIPVSWLPFMIAHARRHQIGLVFGLEHWVVNGKAYNLLIEALPFKVSGKYKSCVMTARLKNHYAPAELEMLHSFRLTPANQQLKSYSYHKIYWNGVCFASYNCFELSDIKHRTVFKSDIDMLIACVWNKDTNYYQHILESAVRDLHCYVVQSNTSQYGGSCVLRPTNTESKTMLYVKGGNNSCVLTTDIDIEALREFHFKSKPGEKDYFKPLPPGYESERVLDR